MEKLAEVDAAWVAGLLEGEGCFSIFKRTTSTQNHKQLNIQCTMTDEDVILKLQDILKLGNIHKVQPSGSKRDGTPYKPAYKWAVDNHAGQKFILESILPYLGERRTAKANELLNYIDTRNSELPRNSEGQWYAR